MPYRKCPHCKGESGFGIVVKVSGQKVLRIGFDGQVAVEEEHIAENAEKFGKCLDCGKNIAATNLDLKDAIVP